VNAVESAPRATTSIRIDPVRRRAVIGGQASVTDVRAAAAQAGLRYPFRPGTIDTTMAEHLQGALSARSWLRQRGPLRQVAHVGLIGPAGRPFVISRDERLGTVHRALSAALREGATLVYAVVELVEPDPHRLCLAVTFEHRVAAALAAQDIVALGRVSSIDIVDEAAMTVVAGFAGLDLYPTGAMVFVELTGVDPAAMQKDARIIEDLCFQHGATAIREREQDDDVADAVDSLVLACAPVFDTLGYAPVHDAVVPTSDVARFVAHLTRFEHQQDVRLTVIVNGSNGRVSCWLAPGTDDVNVDHARALVQGIGTAVTALHTVGGRG
jgi:glycolate oxidase